MCYLQNLIKSRKLVIVRPFMPECTGCIGQSHSGLCDKCPRKISGVALSKRIEQENTLSSKIEELSQPPRVAQLVQPKEALDEIEKQYRETVEKMNR